MSSLFLLLKSLKLVTTSWLFEIFHGVSLMTNCCFVLPSHCAAGNFSVGRLGDPQRERFLLNQDHYNVFLMCRYADQHRK